MMHDCSVRLRSRDHRGREAWVTIAADSDAARAADPSDLAPTRSDKRKVRKVAADNRREQAAAFVKPSVS